MTHAIYRVTGFRIAGPYRLHVSFDDESEQLIDFEPVLGGAIFRPLRNLELFNQVRLDEEVHTLIWPNGADFDPATLHDWPKMAPLLADRARKWEQSLV